MVYTFSRSSYDVRLNSFSRYLDGGLPYPTAVPTLSSARQTTPFRLFPKPKEIVTSVGP